ncbi:dual OB domain-containing protein [Pseudodesulfovibrio karagichevae]|uniref:Dual OB-containing domain-containing protein n=1 Tax=Pseudodesulfovibrio karagichevae TaxID=3239305 RepID=A0ABV4K7E7_9BACT
MPNITFLCLAKSWKKGGVCIAGKKVENNYVTGWIRPISNHDEGGISLAERRYADRTDPQILDYIECGVGEHCPNGAQTENYLIANSRWAKIGVHNGSVAQYCDTPDSLWGIGSSTRNGINDKITEVLASALDESLYLISLDEATVLVREEIEYGGDTKTRVRLSFQYGGHPYILSLSDDVRKQYYLEQGIGEYPLENCHIAVSLSTPYHDHCYKVVAGIIE